LKTWKGSSISTPFGVKTLILNSSDKASPLLAGFAEFQPARCGFFAELYREERTALPAAVFRLYTRSSVITGATEAEDICWAWAPSIDLERLFYRTCILMHKAMENLTHMSALPG
jgi:hypothetical protein